MTDRKSARLKYKRHIVNAQLRGIAFELTFEDWLKIWVDSGHWGERGKRGDQYCMSRFGDLGPYALGNVEIITNAENLRQVLVGNQWGVGNQNALGYKHTDEAKLAMRGPKSEQHKAKLRGPKSEEHRASLRAACGHPQSEETRLKIAAGRRLYFQRKRQMELR
jgi:hypothetical protein